MLSHQYSFNKFMFCFSRLDLTCISESWACQELDQSLPFSGNCFDHRLTSGGEQGCLSSGVFPELLLFPSFWLDPTHSFLYLLPHFCTPFFENDPARVEHCLKPLLWQRKIWRGARSSGSLNWTESGGWSVLHHRLQQWGASSQKQCHLTLGKAGGARMCVAK